jgi:hypothetical protein
LFIFLYLLLTFLLEWGAGQTKDDSIGSFSFYAKHATLKRKSKEWLAWFMFLCLLLIVLLECQSGQTKDHKIGTWYFYAKHAALKRKSKDWLARNHDNVSEWGDMSVCGLLFQWASVAFNCVH